MAPKYQRRLNPGALLLLVALTFGCRSAAEKCSDIRYAAETAPWVREQRREVRSDVTSWAQHIGADSLSRWMDSVRRIFPGPLPYPNEVRPEDLDLAPSFYRMRLADSADYRLAVSDSSMAVRYYFHMVDTAKLREIPLPPRPSEIAWYEEHCYQGKPR